MGQEEIFKRELAELVRLGKNQGNRLSEEQVRDGFAVSEIGEAQLPFVHEYLKEHKIAVGEAFDPEEVMSTEDKDFLAMFMEELDQLPKPSDEEKRQIIMAAMQDDVVAKGRMLELFLPKVVEIAKLYAGQGVYMEDLIGEGNVALAAAVSMAGCVEKPEEAEGFFAGIIMDAMEVLVAEEADEKEVDDKIVEQVNRVAEEAEALYAEMRRKVTPEELAAETDLTVAEIEEAYRLSGEHIDTLEITEKTE